MPGLNRQGPMGQGPVTGRGMGMCKGRNCVSGIRRGMGRSGIVYSDIENEQLKNEVSELKAIVSELKMKLESKDNS